MTATTLQPSQSLLVVQANFKISCLRLVLETLLNLLNMVLLLSSPVRIVLLLVLAPVAVSQKTTTTLPPLLTLVLPPTQALHKPQSLPARTFATLTTTNLTLTATFTRASTFEFRDPPPGNYLCEVWTNSYVFVPMRVDVSMLPAGDDAGSSNGKEDTVRSRSLTKRVDVWQTFRGNEWDNKGELLGSGTMEQGGAQVNVGVLGVRDFYEVRQGCERYNLDQAASY